MLIRRFGQDKKKKKKKKHTPYDDEADLSREIELPEEQNPHSLTVEGFYRCCRCDREKSGSPSAR